jgi:kynurenine formamidase
VAERASSERIGQIFEAVKSWGRWGPDDERGALNYITPALRAAAARSVREGLAVSCAREFPTAPAPDNPTPAQHMMLLAGDAREATGVPGLEASMDYIGVAFHGMAVSHIDALCHVFVDGRMYNGFPASDVKSIGALRNSIMAAGDGIVGRGVLLDIPRLRGVPWLEPGEAIAPEELSAAEAAEGVRVGEGDVLLVATGRDARRAARGPWDVTTEGLAGLHPECVPWLHERRIAVLGSDGVSDPLPGNEAPGWPIPVHQCCLVAMGVHLLDNLQLARLAAACAERSRWEFLFSVAPLRVERGTGSPVNPLALF